MVIGYTNIHEDVFREIVRNVLDDTEGIYQYEPKSPLAPLLGDKGVKPLIAIKLTGAAEESIELAAVEIRLAALYGANIPMMAEKIRRETAAKIKSYTGYDVTAVDIIVTKLIRFDRDGQEEAAKPEKKAHEKKAQEKS